VNACGGKGRKEVLQVEPQDHEFVRMRAGERGDRAPLDESVGVRVCRYLVENLGKDPALQFLKPAFGHSVKRMPPERFGRMR